jgi:3-hydroxy acid dehydrogenase/malonic semialdehyde reductase
MPKPVAVITGASRGIGRAVALRLSQNYDIVAVARSDDELESLALEIERRGGSCRPRTVDITNPDAVNAALSDVDAHVLVNNAGVGMLKPFMELTRDEWTQMVNVNFNALFDVTRAVLPPMIDRKSGHVVFIGPERVSRRHVLRRDEARGDGNDRVFDARAARARREGVGGQPGLGGDAFLRAI